MKTIRRAFGPNTIIFKAIFTMATVFILTTVIGCHNMGAKTSQYPENGSAECLVSNAFTNDSICPVVGQAAQHHAIETGGNSCPGCGNPQPHFGSDPTDYIGGSQLPPRPKASMGLLHDDYGITATVSFPIGGGQAPPKTPFKNAVDRPEADHIPSDRGRIELPQYPDHGK